MVHVKKPAVKEYRFYVIFEHVIDGRRIKQSGKCTVNNIPEPSYEVLKMWENKLVEAGLKEVVILDWKKIA